MDIETTKRLAFLASRGRFQESSDSLGPTDQNSTPPATTTASQFHLAIRILFLFFKEVCLKYRIATHFFVVLVQDLY